MSKERLLEILRGALGYLDLMLTEDDDEDTSDGCQQEKICEMLGISEEEFEEIKGITESEETPGNWYPGGSPWDEGSK